MEVYALLKMCEDIYTERYNFLSTGIGRGIVINIIKSFKYLCDMNLESSSYIYVFKLVINVKNFKMYMQLFTIIQQMNYYYRCL